MLITNVKNNEMIFDTSSNSQIDEEGLTIKLKGQYKVVANDYKKGFILYDQQQINLAYVNLKGKVRSRFCKIQRFITYFKK